MLVVDASMLVEVLVGSPRGRQARERLLAAAAELCAPHVIDLEVVQTIRRAARRGHMSGLRAAVAVRRLRSFPLTRFSHEHLLGRIWSLRENLSAYDAAYVALAEALDAPLLTCDARLASALGHRAKIELVDQSGASG